MKDFRDIPYIGNGAYCYANATAMFLSSVNENISPSFIEVLSGIGVGAVLLTQAKLLFFNTVAGAPDTGISKALEILGINYKEKANKDSNHVPFRELQADLISSPAILGPLDMGYLTYNPRHKFLSGADHFILVYEIKGQEAYLHDPAGFPHVSIKLSDLAKAWEAKNIGYKRGYYRYWTNPKRIKKPSQNEIYDQAIQFFQFLYKESERLAKKDKWIIDRNAIMSVVEKMRNKEISNREKDHFTYFAFPLGAKRALDFAQFFDFRDSSLATLKRKQAQLFGKSHSLAMRADWKSLAQTLEEFADAEDKFRVSLLSKL